MSNLIGESMGKRVCTECKTVVLTGLQRKYCSPLCCQRAWRADPENRARDQAASREWKAANCEANRQRDRDYNRALRDKCVACGGLRGAGSARRPPGRCDSCRGAGREARRNTIEHYWNLGWTIKEIAALMESTVGSIGVEMVHMRADGRDLPRRYAVEDGRRVAA